MNFGAHSKFVTKWLEKVEVEEKQAAKPSQTATGDAPTAPTEFAAPVVPADEHAAEPAAPEPEASASEEPVLEAPAPTENNQPHTE